MHLKYMKVREVRHTVRLDELIGCSAIVLFAFLLCVFNFVEGTSVVE